MKKFISVISRSAVVLLGCAVLTSCYSTLQSGDIYKDRGQPEDLLDMSVEQVTVPLDHARGIDDLRQWLNQRQATSAVVQCAKNDMLCVNAGRVLSDFVVPFSKQASQGGNQVVLTYETLVVKDCDQRFVDKPYNRYNLRSDAIGCATASNMVNMVSDKRQFTNPELLGYTDGTQAAQTYDDYLAGPTDDGGAESLLEDLTAE